MAGFTWQDDYTQHVMAQELANLPKAYSWHGEASSPGRTLQQNADSKKWFHLENEVALAKTLQRYLPYLGLLSQAPTANAQPRIEHETRPVKLLINGEDAADGDDVADDVNAADSEDAAADVNAADSEDAADGDDVADDVNAADSEDTTDGDDVADGEVAVNRKDDAHRRDDAGGVGLLLMGKDSFPENILTYVAQTSALTYPPATRVKYPDNLLWPFNRLQLDELSPKVDSDADKQQLIAALNAYTAQRPPGENDAGPQYLLQSPMRASKSFPAPAASQRWPLSPGDAKDPLSMGDGSYKAELSINNIMDHIVILILLMVKRVCMCHDPDSGPSELRLTLISCFWPVDTLLRRLLKDLQQQAEVDRLDPLKLEEMADSMAGAIQSDPSEGSQDSRGRKADGQLREQSDAPEAALEDHRLSEVDDPVYDEVSRLSVQLGDLMKDRGSPLLPEAPLLEKSSRAEIKKSEQPEEVLSSEEETAGVEHVRSRTYSKDLLEKKPYSEPQSQRLEDQFQNRAPEVWEEEQTLKSAVQGPPSGGLQLEVQPSEEEQLGYILTGNNPLSPEKGKQLMDDVAHILRVPSSFFVDV
ncbi:hypothetical protein STEG23_001295, partial [Scotinomys teguina]